MIVSLLIDGKNMRGINDLKKLCESPGAGRAQRRPGQGACTESIPWCRILVSAVPAWNPEGRFQKWPAWVAVEALPPVPPTVIQPGHLCILGIMKKFNFFFGVAPTREEDVDKCDALSAAGVKELDASAYAELLGVALDECGKPWATLEAIGSNQAVQALRGGGYLDDSGSPTEKAKEQDIVRALRDGRMFWNVNEVERLLRPTMGREDVQMLDAPTHGGIHDQSHINKSGLLSLNIVKRAKDVTGWSVVQVLRVNKAKVGGL